MRRTNLTISFDPEFIQAMDSAREGESRGTWLERHAASDVPSPYTHAGSAREQGGLPAGLLGPEPERPPKAERLEKGRRIVGGMVRQPRPLVQKREK